MDLRLRRSVSVALFATVVQSVSPHVAQWVAHWQEVLAPGNISRRPELWRGARLATQYVGTYTSTQHDIRQRGKARRHHSWVKHSKYMQIGRNSALRKFASFSRVGRTISTKGTSAQSQLSEMRRSYSSNLSFSAT